MNRDPAANTPLDELVTANVAGDIDAVADRLDAIEEHTPTPGLLELSNLLRRIATGVRSHEATAIAPHPRHGTSA